jgi:hypothetical protein
MNSGFACTEIQRSLQSEDRERLFPADPRTQGNLRAIFERRVFYMRLALTTIAV